MTSTILNKGICQTGRVLKGMGQVLLGLGQNIDTVRVISGKEKKVLLENRRFAKSKAGETAFIVGNGPSLNKSDLNKIQGRLILTSNGFARHKIIGDWQPTYHTLSDPAYFRNWQKYIPEFEMMRNRLCCEYFIPIEHRDTVFRNRLLPENKCHSIYSAGDIAHIVVPPVDLTKAIPHCQTVTLTNILISIYLGASRIILLGMDHDFLSTPKNPTHFCSDYERNTQGEGFAEWSYLSLIQACEKMWKGYDNIRKLSERNGIQILNASPGSFLDVFPSSEYNDVI